MENNITFIMRREWLEHIEDLPIEQQDKIIADMVRYGSELPLEHLDDKDVKSYVNFIKKSIDDSKANYAARQENGKTNGRKKVVDSREVHRLAVMGKGAKDIAMALGVGVDSIYHDAGWKNRKDPMWNGL